VIWIKLRLKQEFPQTFIEAWRPYADANGALVIGGPTATDLPPRQTYQQALGSYGSWSLPNGGESSACLYLALNQGRSGIATNIDSSILTSTELISTQNPAVKQFADPWGTNLVFSRWPYEDPGLNPNTAEVAPPWRDPEDPEGLLSDPDPAWFNSRGYSAFAVICHPTGGAKKSYKLQPVIVSAGPDRNFGLQDFRTLRPAGAPAGAKAYDNIYSHRIRLGGTSN
jgi:hypothetical protein